MKSLLYHKSDNELLQNISNGDSNAFSQLYNKYKKSLIAFAYQKLLNSDEAEDVVHDVFARLWQNKESICIHVEFKYYIFTAVKNRILNLIATSRRYENYTKLIIIHFAKHKNDTDYMIREKSFFEYVENLISNYSITDKKIFELRVKGYKNAEIAKQLGLKEKTIRNKYCSLLKNIKIKLIAYTL